MFWIAAVVVGFAVTFFKLGQVSALVVFLQLALAASLLALAGLAFASFWRRTFRR